MEDASGSGNIEVSETDNYRVSLFDKRVQMVFTYLHRCPTGINDRFLEENFLSLFSLSEFTPSESSWHQCDN